MPAYYILVAHGEGSMSEFGYEYSSLSSSAIGKNLGLRGMVYDFNGPHFEASPSSHDHDYANEQPD